MLANTETSQKGSRAATRIERGYARTQQAFARAQRHSRRIRILKIVVPAAAAMIAVGFFAISYLLTPKSTELVSTSSAMADGKLVMANPKMEGVTSDNRSYAMNAIRAIQDMKTPNIIELEELSARLPIGADAWATVDAPHGTYDRTVNTIDFRSPFMVKTTEGLAIAFQSAFLDIGKGEVTTSQPVDITLNGTRIQADSMSVRDKGKQLVFEHRVRVVLPPGAAKSTQADNGG